MKVENKRRKDKSLKCSSLKEMRRQGNFSGLGENDQSLSFSVLLVEERFAMSKASEMFMVCRGRG